MTHLCSVKGCRNDVLVKSRALCRLHYRRWLKSGTVNARKISKPGEALSWLFDIALNHSGDACLIWPFGRESNGYGRVYYKKRVRSAHRLVCKLAHGKPPTKSHYACHSCGRGEDGCVNQRHIYWGTHKDNEADKVEHGTVAVGEALPQSKLSDSKVVKILKLIKRDFSNREIAERFGVAPWTIGRIRHNKSWKHIDRG